MPILPLPQFEADLAEQDREIYERLKPPSSMVVRFGVMKMVGEFPYDAPPGSPKPGCGSKIVIRSHRGTELGDLLTSTCPNAGCSKSVTRKEMLEYIENSGGKDYPFFSMQGKVLRIATPEDLNRQLQLDETKSALVKKARELVAQLNLPMKIVEAEPILGEEKLTFYFTSEDRIDFRELVNALAGEYKTRIDLRQVGARDEARLIADYERCGQHCCCKQFLKVLKPISMKSAKIQKATLDPLKISGRCGRLMCCLRYEDQTYDELRKRLPRKKSRVYTEHGWGYVVDSQILTQLVLVHLEDKDEQVAVPVEEISSGPDAQHALPAKSRSPGGAPADDLDSHSDDDDFDTDQHDRSPSDRPPAAREPRATQPRPADPRRSPEQRPDYRRPDDRPRSDRRPPPDRPSNRRPDDRRSDDRRSADRPRDDRPPSNRRLDDRRPADRRPDDRSPDPRRQQFPPSSNPPALSTPRTSEQPPRDSSFPTPSASVPPDQPGFDSDRPEGERLEDQRPEGEHRRRRRRRRGGFGPQSGPGFDRPADGPDSPPPPSSSV